MQYFNSVFIIDGTGKVHIPEQTYVVIPEYVDAKLAGRLEILSYTDGTIRGGMHESGDVVVHEEYVDEDEEGNPSSVVEHVTFTPQTLRDLTEEEIIDVFGGNCVFVGIPPTTDMVREEASRRMRVLTNARSRDHLEQIIANGNREAIRLLNIGSANWTPEMALRAKQLEGFDMAIEAIRASSNAIEEDPPKDYKDDKYWPDLTRGF